MTAGTSTIPSVRDDGDSGDIKELRAKLQAMREAAQPFLSSSARAAYWSQVWELEVVHAAIRVTNNRRQFYSFRLMAVASAIIVPSLVGLNLSGTGGAAVRWLTFSLSLVAAISTAVLTLFRFGDRWLMNRTLKNELIKAGWVMLNSSQADPDKPWSVFTAATNAAVARYNLEYTAEVITPAQPRAENQYSSAPAPGHQRERHGQAA